MDELIAKHIDRYLADESENSGHRNVTAPKFYVSDAGRCRTMRYRKRMGIEPEGVYDQRTARIFALGHLLHGWVQGVLEKQGVLMAAEFKVEDKHRKGYMDALVMDGKDAVLYDIKTVSSRKFHYNMNNKSFGDKHYAMQALTGKMMLSEPIADVRIAYISKDDLFIKEVSAYEMSSEEDTQNDWDELIEAWEKGEEPAPNPAKWECKYCLYGQDCKKQQNKEVKQMQSVDLAAKVDMAIDSFPTLLF